MTRKRLDLGKDGLLRERDGTVVGRLVSLTVELGGEGPLGGKGVKEIQGQTTLAVGSSDACDNSSVGGVGEVLSEVEEVWAHYERVVPGAKRLKLDAKRRSIIGKALKVRPKVRCCEAIDGLAASPHHNGQNDRGKKYLGIQYALKGMGAESDDERIDKACGWAGNSVADVLANIPSAGREMVRQRQNQVEQMLLHPESTHLTTRGLPSQAYLAEQFGLSASLVDGHVVWHRATA